MKAIMISIKPEWNEKILNREKTLEIRTTCPKEWKDYLNGKSKTKPEPMQVVIYCTNGKYILSFDIAKQKYALNIKNGFLNRQVVAEFTLNQIDKIEICDPDVLVNGKVVDIIEYKKDTCLKLDEFMDYIGYGDDHDGWGNKEYAVGYAWHIDNLKIYDKPKELSEFRKDLDCDDYPCNKGKFCEHDYFDWSEGCEACAIDFDGEHCIYKTLKRPPQSWCYVEELENE